MAKVGTCGSCGRKAQIIGRGLCYKCRKRAISNGTYKTMYQTLLAPSKEQQEAEVLSGPVIKVKPEALAERRKGMPGSPLDDLLSGNETLEIPEELWVKVEAKNLTKEHLLEFIGLLVDGKLRKISG